MATAAIAPEATGDGALAGLRVLDLTTFLSGPFATQILGDLGAEIIKVEHPDGDMTRLLPPYFVGPDSAYFHSINRNKKSVCLDLKKEEGRAVLAELVAQSDVVVENFRPGVLAKLGLAAESLVEKHPHLVWCSLSGFGQDGPYRDRPAYDMIVQAQSGGMSLTGEHDGRPVRSGIPIGDLAAGLYSTIGILAALESRRSTGRGQVVDVAMLDCQIALLSYQAAYHLNSGVVPGRQGTGHDSIPTYRSFTCGDGTDVAVTANTERMWAGLCEALDLAELKQDPRYLNNERRYANRFQLWEVLEARFRKQTAEGWLKRLIECDVPAAVVNTLDKALRDPQVQHRGMVLDLEDAEGLKLGVAGNPIRMSRTRRERHAFPPRLAADTAGVLASVLGLDAARIGSLAASGAIKVA